jgi:hypothetical protein
MQEDYTGMAGFKSAVVTNEGRKSRGSARARMMDFAYTSPSSPLLSSTSLVFHTFYQPLVSLSRFHNISSVSLVYAIQCLMKCATTLPCPLIVRTTTSH